MHYSIVYTGKIRDGATLPETRRNLAELFKIGDAAVLDRLFSGKTVLLKKNLSEDEARKQEMILYMAGAVCEVRNNTPPHVPPAPVAVASEPSPAPVQAPSPTALSIAAAPAPVLTLMPTPAPAAPAVTAPRQDRLAERDEVLMPAAWRRPPREDAGRDQASAPASQGRDAEPPPDPMLERWHPDRMPDGVKGLSWAGFMAPLLWGSFNGMRLSFVPLLGVRLLRHLVPAWGWAVFLLAFGGFYLVKGRELAWRNKLWENGEHFNRVQRYWTFGAAAFFLLTVYGLVHLTQVEHHRQRAAAALNALTSADLAFASAASAEAKESAKATRSQARAEYLASLDDKGERERTRQSFADQDRDEAEAEAKPATESADAPPSSE